jgi:hypothetical protein
MTTIAPTKNITEQLNDTYKQFKEKMGNLDKEFQFYLILMLVLVIVVSYLYYLLYLYNLRDKNINFMDKTYPEMNSYILPVSTTKEEFSKTLMDYYIKTAYNACSGGAYRNSFVDISHLKTVIKQGARCLDFEIYSIDNQPVVATSTVNDFFVKETFNSVPFGGENGVMDTINNYAFASGTAPNPTDPLIIHLRIYSSNQEMFTNLAGVFRKYDRMLGSKYSFENTGKNLGKEPLLTFLNSIILIVDRSNTAFLENNSFLEFVNLTSNSIFMRGLRYYDVKNNPDADELTNYNRAAMTIVFPDNEIDPPNPSGVLCRVYGCQMVAMRYQYVDTNLMANNTFFQRAGSAFVLKPEHLRYIPEFIKEPIKQNPNLSYETREFGNQYFQMNV